MNGGLRKNGSVSHRSNPAPRCDQIQQQVTITKKRKKRTSNFFNQDGQTLPGFQTPGGPGWQAVEEKSNSRDDINSNESFLGYSNQVTSYQIGCTLLWAVRMKHDLKPSGELKGKLPELQPGRQPHRLKVSMVGMRIIILFY